MPSALILDGRDNVAVALKPISAGEIINLCADANFKVNHDIPFAHKIALKNVGVGEAIYKYGEIIGVAYNEISAGDHVHIHNIRSVRNQVTK
jgi:predicted RecA/RadA family phage recombinase